MKCNNGKNRFTPKPKQLNLLQTIRCNGFPESWKALSSEVGISFSQLWRWRKDKNFWDWFSEQLRQDFPQETFRIRQKLIEKALKGSPEHMKIYFQMTGELGKNEKVEIEKKNVFKVKIDNANNIQVTRISRKDL